MCSDNKYNIIHDDSKFFYLEEIVIQYMYITSDMRAIFFCLNCIVVVILAIISESMRLIYSYLSELLQWLRENLVITSVCEENLMGTGKFSHMASLRWAITGSGNILSTQYPASVHYLTELLLTVVMAPLRFFKCVLQDTEFAVVMQP